MVAIERADRDRDSRDAGNSSMMAMLCCCVPSAVSDSETVIGLSPLKERDGRNGVWGGR